MPVPSYDAYNHISAAPGAALPCIALSNSPSTSVGIGPLAAAGTGGAGAGSTTSYVGGTGTGTSAVDTLKTGPNDSRGQFILTAAGTPVGGLVAQINFTQPYNGVVTPLVSCVDVTASPNVAVVVGALLNATAPGTTTGFQVCSTSALTAAHSYQITYEVNP